MLRNSIYLLLSLLVLIGYSFQQPIADPLGENEMPLLTFSEKMASEIIYDMSIRQHTENGTKTFATFIFRVFSIPMLYCRQEASINKQLKFFEKNSIRILNLSTHTQTLNLTNKSVSGGNTDYFTQQTYELVAGQPLILEP